MKERRLNLGILAHVDAGKTTLAEGLLYTAGALRKAGRVDHQDTFLDNYALERQRGITIFSKQALLSRTNDEGEEVAITLLDTPGHVDFSAEMERTLQVLDYAILVISGADGVQGHAKTLWGLLKRYGIPTFLFVNKMDQNGTDEKKLLRELQERLDERCTLFASWQEGTTKCIAGQEEFWESLSLCDEDLMEEYLETGGIARESVREAIADRKVFPTYFGSALKLIGVEELLDAIANDTLPLDYPEEFGARVYKIGRDKQGNRLTYLKVTGGVLKAKQMIGAEEKVDQIRLYNGQGFQVLQEAPAGCVCAVTGLSKTKVGDGLGSETGSVLPSLEPVMTYLVKLPDDYDPVTALGQIRRIEEEEPLLHVHWNEALREIHVSVMGEVQVEVLENLLMERYELKATFEDGSIVYKETIAEPVLGVGHYEPLRHYAEVQFLMEPGERGSGLQFASLVSEDDFDKNWQRLIMTHLEERTHVGVLMGGELTDLRITIVGGQAHVKHTEGGDFRQATYRAIRQGLRNAKCLLLEPIYDFTLEVPVECLGRAMTDLQRMQGRFEAPDVEGEMGILTGSVPAATIAGYQREVASYARGLGKLSYVLKGYEVCHNAEEVLKAHPYDPDGDVENPTFSIFCSHGAGTPVPWDQVYGWAHVPLRLDFLEAAKRWQERAGNAEEEAREGISAEERLGILKEGKPSGNSGGSVRSSAPMERVISQEEIDAIFTAGRRNQNKKQNDRQGYRRYHRGNRPSEPPRVQGESSASSAKTVDGAAGKTGAKKAPAQKESCILVDGYNVIFSWPELRDLMKVNVGSARDRLIHEMSDYQGYVGGTLILVFDAYKVKGNVGTIDKAGNIYVVYTKEAETADQYIEKTVHQMASKYQITVATSDGLEQMIIWGDGAMRTSSLGLKADLEARRKQAKENYGIVGEEG